MSRKEKQQDKLLLQVLKRLGRNLKELRDEKLELNQVALSSASGVSVSTISEIENCGAPDVRLSTICSIANQLGVDPIELLKK